MGRDLGISFAMYIHHPQPQYHRVSTNVSAIYNSMVTSAFLHSNPLLRLCVRVVYVNDLLHLVITPHEDARSIVYMLRHDRQHALHPAVDGLSARYIHPTMSQSHFLRHRGKEILEENVPFSNTSAIGAHSYKIRNFPFGLFLSAGYAKMPPYNNVRYASATIDPI